MKKDKSVQLYTLLKRYLTWPLIGLWMLSMSLLTWAVGKDFYNQLESAAGKWATYVAQEDTYHLPGEMRYEISGKLSNSYNFFRCDSLLPLALPQVPSSYSSNDWIYGKWWLMYGFQGNFTFYDRQYLEPILTSSDTYLVFSYGNTLAAEKQGWAYIDLDDLPQTETLSQMIYNSPHWGFTTMQGTLRLTGRLEGDRFYPQKIESTEFPFTVYYESDEPMEDTVTVYNLDGASDRMGHRFDPGPGFFWDWVWYDDPGELLGQLRQGADIQDGYGFFNSLILVTASNKDYLARGAIHCSPFLYAVTRLWPLYLVTALAIVIVLIRLKKRLRQKLIEPFHVIDEAFRQNRTELSDFADSPVWELQSLSGHFHTAQQDRHRTHDQVQQLQTALDYARDAEEKRKTMVNAMAHELKTPLAVINSYAEGLQEGIAPEKQDQYLSVIRQEAQIMDTMVLQMLELSRLEAGKVKLEPEQFSLTKLTTGLLETLQATAGERVLQLDSPQDISVTADKGKIRQVITNLMTNAIKYAQGDGPVQIRVFRRSLSVYFIIENPCPPLPQETLEKVFDSFFRADTARDRSGTGLGLAIVKSIIKLHRGECKVRNTKTGVEFSFVLPLS